MAHKLLNLLAVTSLAIMACSFGAEPVNAISTGSHHVRNGLRGHDALAKRKRSVNGKRCKVRPTPSDSGDSSNPTSSTDSDSTSQAVSTPAPSPTPTPSSTPSPSPADSSSSTLDSSSTSPTPTPSSTPVSSNPGNFGAGKGCLAWPNGDQSYLGDYKTDKTSLIYTWSESGPSDAASLGFTFAPQLWGWKNADAFKNAVVPGYSNVALFINEPNEGGQSNIDAATAAGMWKTYMEPLKAQGYTLVSAATSSNPNGVTWMNDFFTACNGGCSVDIMAVHWYDTTSQKFKDYVELWHNTFQRPIWVTEFALQDFNGGGFVADLPTIQGFMGDVTGWMDQQDYVQKYCWFGAMLDMQNVNPLNTLMNPDGSPSSLGNQFLYSG